MSDLVLNGAESVKNLKIMKQAKLIDTGGSPFAKKNHYFVELAILGKGVTKLFWPFFHQSIVPRVGISKMVVHSISAP